MPVKNGVTTSEFWVTALTNVLAVLAVVFHANTSGLSVYIPYAATTAAGVANIVYTIMRTYHKTAAIKAVSIKAVATVSSSPVQASTPEPKPTAAATVEPQVTVAQINPEAFGS